MVMNRALTGLRRNEIGRRGFTLLELLVVIAIIALLVAILLPALESARRQAKSVTCMANIKNIGSSARVYEADDAQGYGIPVHPLQKAQPSNSPTFIGAHASTGQFELVLWDRLQPAAQRRRDAS